MSVNDENMSFNENPLEFLGLTESDLSLHYYKVTFDNEEVNYIWYEKIKDFQTTNINAKFSAIIRIVPIEKEEAERLQLELKADGYPKLSGEFVSQEYIYNKWSKYKYSVGVKDFLLCDSRMKVERMSWRSALYLAFRLFSTSNLIGYYGGFDRYYPYWGYRHYCYRYNDYWVKPYKPIYPEYNINSYSVSSTGELTLFTNAMLNTRTSTMTNDKKVYFLVKKSTAKTGYVSKFLEKQYYDVVSCSVGAIVGVASTLRSNSQESTYEYEQLNAKKIPTEDYTSSSSGQEGESSSSSSIPDKWSGCKKFGIYGYEYLYELHEETVSSKNAFYDYANKCYVKSIGKAQTFTYFVVGEGSISFMDYGKGEDENLLYPYLSSPSGTKDNLPIGKPSFPDVYRTLVYSCFVYVPEPSSSSSSSKSSSSSGGTGGSGGGGTGGGGGGTKPNPPTTTKKDNKIPGSFNSPSLGGGFISMYDM